MQDDGYTQMALPPARDAVESDTHRAQRSATIRSPFRLGAAIFGSLALVSLLILIGVWALLAQDKAREHQRQEAALASLARALEEHAARAFGQADNAIGVLTTALGEYGRLDPGIQRKLEDTAALWLLRLPYVQVISVGDAQGRQLLSVRQNESNSDLQAPFFALPDWQRGANTRLLIGKPFRSARDGNWYIPAGRGVADANGALLAVVTTLIDINYFQDFYRDIRLTTEDSIAILGNDGTLLMRFPMQEKLMGTQVPPQSIYQQAPFGQPLVMTDTRLFDDVPRMAAFRRLVDYPLVVAASRPMETTLADFQQMRRRLLFGAGTLISLLGLMAALSYYDARQREEARAQLGRINATLESRVKRRTAELEQTNRELVAFSYTISHDLRAPLRAINGFAHALGEDYGERLDAQGRDYLDRVYRGSIRMGDLIDELLSLANISRQPLSVQPINLSSIADDIATDMRAADPSREAHIDIQPNIRVEGDEALLRNALYNLLHNAWKFTRSRRPGIITVSEEDDGEFTRITVADNGVGFDMAHAKRLFQPFQQLHVRQGYSGTGIGLASVRRIIERHGGRIWAESMPDDGARFIFTLPHRATVIRRRHRKQTA